MPVVHAPHVGPLAARGEGEDLLCLCCVLNLASPSADRESFPIPLTQRGGTTKAAAPGPDPKASRPAATTKYEWNEAFTVPATLYKARQGPSSSQISDCPQAGS